VLFAAAGRQGARPSTIAERTGMAPPNVTSVLSRLEERGLILRGPDPDDRRATMIMLSQEGRQLAREIAATGREKFEASLSHLTDEELAGLARGLAAVARAMDERSPRRTTPDAT
jgi:DNA-binding MarR family transcriptional regulator